MKLSIREATLDDAVAIFVLSGQLGYATNEEDIRNRLRDILSNEDNCVYVARVDGKIIAWIHSFYARRIESEAFIEIGGLIVDEQYRKYGIGKALIERISDWAKSKECYHLRVRCNEVRKESHLFYENLGFEINKVQKIFNKKLK